MKLLFPIILIAAFVLGGTQKVAAQKSIDTSDFEISIEMSASGTFKLFCTKGCAWEKLGFKYPNSQKVISLSDVGMGEEDILSKFSFSIQRKEQTILLMAQKGIAWTQLEYPITNNSFFVQVNAKGAITSSAKKM